MAKKTILTGGKAGQIPKHVDSAPGDEFVNADGETVATKNPDGKLKISEIPDEAVTVIMDAASQNEMLALDVQAGDICRRIDIRKTFILSSPPASELSNWKEMLAEYQHAHFDVHEARDPAIQIHIRQPHAPVDAQKNSDILKEEIEAKLLGGYPVDITDLKVGDILRFDGSRFANSEVVAARTESIGNDYQAVGQTYGAHRVFTLDSSGNLKYADPFSVTDVHRIVGISTRTILDGEFGNIVRGGPVEEGSWSWNPEVPVYLGPNGTMIQTVPVSGFMVIVAFPVTPTKVIIDIKTPIEIA